MLPTSRNSLKRVKLSNDIWNAARCFTQNNPCRHSRNASSVPSTPGTQPRHILRNMDWNVKADTGFQRTQTRSAVAQLNLAMEPHAKAGALGECLSLASRMKAANLIPDTQTYNLLLMASASPGQSPMAWAIMEDMELTGVEPNQATFYHLLQAQQQMDTSYCWRVLDKQTALGIEPTSAACSEILLRFIKARHLEFAIQFLREMRLRGIAPELKPASDLVKLAASRGFPRLALDLLDFIEVQSMRKLDHEVWTNCLISSAEALFGEGVVRCWNVVVQELSLAPDEGLCVAVLHTAARNGMPDLATDALRVLQLIGCEIQEHHFASLLEAFVRAKQLKEAFTTLAIMRSNGVTPLPETCLPILHEITSVESIDNTWNLIDDMHRAGATIDVAALNVIMQATVAVGDLQRAVGAYKSYSDYSASPDVHTFNSLLEGCTNAAHRELGDHLLAEMKEAKVKPDRDTYLNLVMLCLTQETYEDAFFYLEEMKAAKHRPPISMYEAIVRRCVLASDPRYEIAIAEMKEIGYHPSRELLRDIDAALQQHQVAQPEPPVAPRSLDGAAQRFIETGGLQQ
ncbi:hypothetical protein HGRIS_002436 [Hohenbuehelia grisea]|uniref:Pentatricopeptide repeat-containing protein n=1 Tax=Hohenbuehelia grisea TaxID=104357 RepID=A0ABR3JLK8_9AGAR